MIKSPFKFLDPYTLADRDSFFGREKEISALYEMVFQTNLLLVYGPSGVGKTSLLQCGLASRFQETDWYDLHIRWRGDINESFHREIEKHAIAPLQPDWTISQKVHSLYLDHFKPIFLIFDQFEELYILGTKPERTQFIQSIAELLEQDIPFKIIISMREEYIAWLNDFETQVPSLFEHRLRIEPMDRDRVAIVIRNLAEKYNIELQDPETTIEQIIDNISIGSEGIQLSYLQVYLDHLYREYHKLQQK